MDDDQPSTTARISAFGRALHRELERPVVFDDHLAAAWFTPEDRAILVDNLSRALAFFEPGRVEPTPEASALAMLRGQSLGITLARARFAEQALAPHHAQYVVLGAGLDTFAFRTAADLDVFELDHPATQRWKRARIAALGWQAPRLRFVEVDLDRASPADALRAAGFDRARPTHIAWLGVTYYLAPERVPSLLAELAHLCAPGSSIAFDFLEPAAFAPGTRIARMREATSRSREPMRTALDPARLGDTVAAAGWDLAEVLGPDEITARFRYPALPHFWLARAMVRG